MPNTISYVVFTEIRPLSVYILFQVSGFSLWTPECFTDAHAQADGKVTCINHFLLSQKLRTSEIVYKSPFILNNYTGVSDLRVKMILLAI